MRSFRLPTSIDGTRVDVEMGKQMLLAWRLDRCFRVELPVPHERRMTAALATARRFFSLSPAHKARCTSDLSYSGYTGPGDRLVEGRPDRSERFIAGKDLAVDDPRVQAQWPCHGPVPWPDDGMARAVTAVMADLGGIGARLLRLVALGLEIFDIDTLVRLTDDGWHHLTAVNVPAGSPPGGEPSASGCGMLVMATGGDPRAVTVTPGDSLQFLSGGYLSSTGARLPAGGLVYFHEPNFQSTLEPLTATGRHPSMHYGAHFTGHCMRSYPERLTTWRILAENRLSVLGHLSGARRAA